MAYDKMFFGYNKYYNVTAVLIDLKLPSFNTVMNLRSVYKTLVGLAIC